MKKLTNNLDDPFGALWYEVAGYNYCDKNDDHKKKVFEAVEKIRAEISKDITKAPEVLFEYLKRGGIEQLRRQFTSTEVELSADPEMIAADLIRAALKTTKPLKGLALDAAVYCRIGSEAQLGGANMDGQKSEFEKRTGGQS